MVIADDLADGQEDERLDELVQSIARGGNRVIDSNLTVDYESNPPVTGWVLYEESAQWQQNNVLLIQLNI